MATPTPHPPDMDGARTRDTSAGNACQCYFNPAEIKQQQWQLDPSQCLHSCKGQFLQSVLKGWGDHSGWVEGCKYLNTSLPVRKFWSLYWCDSTFCGVGINQTGGLGQDPTVDLIINTCQNIGFHSIIDPGPPPANFKCSTEVNTPGICSATVGQVSQTTAQTQRPTPIGSTSTVITTTSATPKPSVATSESRAVAPGATGTPAAGASTTSGSGMTGQGKAATAICSALALILLITFALVWLRRRKRRALRSRHGVSHIPPASSPTPLISPTSSGMGTGAIVPPLRLRDRKFLPSILRPGSRSPSPPLTPLTPAYSPPPGHGPSGAVFPASPICSPTTNKLVPRHERAVTPRGAYLPSSPLAPLSPHALSPQGSTFSLPVPVPGSWPVDPTTVNRASSCYTATAPGSPAGTSTAHSSLRHEIPIGVGAGVGLGTPFFASPPPPSSATPPPAALKADSAPTGLAGPAVRISSTTTASTPTPPPASLASSSMLPPPTYHSYPSSYQYHTGYSLPQADPPYPNPNPQQQHAPPPARRARTRACWRFRTLSRRRRRRRRRPWYRPLP
ncbi:fd66ef94-53d1-4f89-af9b-9ddec5a867fd [Thermothielavioides terrestris]|uniref:Fd66ef94-53d1-4f89-af9b-9ddec5a867fd n=1 Tax=Thermothielavioides terrestris TaxID=2587410 RepID=A0A3S4AQG8_9PEZI|nr:fd66ef94-53d1-4f89-af9b-9ddec5a867fd [Thermothielavioides terrestris]